MMKPRPCFVLLGGPNGAGKSTCASELLPTVLSIADFVNADEIAREDAHGGAGSSIRAGRKALARLEELVRRRASFAFESNLAGTMLARWIARQRKAGYRFVLVFVWLPNADTAVARVRERVRNGGHDIPESTIRRRYARGLANFFRLYRPLADKWLVFDNSGRRPRLVARGRQERTTDTLDAKTWRSIEASARSI